MAETAPAIAALVQAVNIAGKAIKKVKDRKAKKQASLAKICEHLHRMISAMNEARPHYNEHETERAEAAMRLALLCEAEVKKWMCSPATARDKEEQVKCHLGYVLVISENAQSRRLRTAAHEILGNIATNAANNTPQDTERPSNESQTLPRQANEVTGPPELTPAPSQPRALLRSSISFEDINPAGRIRLRAAWDTGMDVQFQGERATAVQPLSFSMRSRRAPEFAGDTETGKTRSDTREDATSTSVASSSRSDDSIPVFESMAAAAVHLAEQAPFDDRSCAYQREVSRSVVDTESQNARCPRLPY